MSGEINYRNFGQAKQVAPKYLSDQLSGFYGTWYNAALAPITTIAYDNLPTGDTLARIYKSMNQFDLLIFEFSKPENILDYELGFYYKENSNEYDTYIYPSMGDKSNWATSARGYAALNGAGAAPLIWTKKTFNLERGPFSSGGGGWRNGMGRNDFVQRCRTIVFYVGTGAGWPHTLEVSGMNIRRL